MKKILFMTVGTGVGNNIETTESLAHGLLSSIVNVDPDFTVFFGSDGSKKTVDSIKAQYLGKYNKNFENYVFVHLNNINNFSDCFKTIEEKLSEYSPTDIIKFNYTSGTKTMSVASAICATLYKKELILVNGTRNDTNIVIGGTEENIQQNLFRVYDKLNLEKVKEFFNINMFESAKIFLEKIKILDKKDIYSDLIDYYNHWDKFNHESAVKLYSQDFSNLSPNMNIQIQNNIKVLNIINSKANFKTDEKENDLRCYYILADLLNNADRRAGEGKYDDAIARLYRSLELIAQIKLKKGYRLITSNIDIEKVKKYCTDAHYINRLNQQKNSHGKVQSGLKESFNLLNCLGDDLGKEFKKSEKKIGSMLSHRNMSILAHGLEHKNKKEYLEFKSVVLNLAKFLYQDIENFMEEAKFPKFGETN
ncbi:MAG: TIGR02710 family CRISPR-associated protein [Methanobrevibacter sp.]|jgi:CRISPR-associated protein (TIGR02710 family)|nr:TIGR02710 family CRISPR-associated protein [Candidatus Methanovirga australis]